MDADGKLSPVEIETVLAHFKANASGSGCPLCGNKNWILAEYVVEMRPFTGGNFRLGGPVYPAVLAFCGACGYMALTSAVKIGLFPGVPGFEAANA